MLGLSTCSMPFTSCPKVSDKTEKISVETCLWPLTSGLPTKQVRMFCLERLRETHDLETVSHARKPDLHPVAAELREGNHGVRSLIGGQSSLLVHLEPD